MFFVDETVESLFNFCAKRRMHRVPAGIGKKVVGIIRRRDILRELGRIYSEY